MSSLTRTPPEIGTISAWNNAYALPMKHSRLRHADALEQGLTDIGRASRASGVSMKSIRHYEAIGLLPRVGRTRGNYRLYSMNDVHTLRFIKRARDLGFSIDEIRHLLALWQDRSLPCAAVKRMAGEQIAELKRKLAELDAMIGTLRRLAGASRSRHFPLGMS